MLRRKDANEATINRRNVKGKLEFFCGSVVKFRKKGDYAGCKAIHTTEL
jgi:hypothetical protein